MHEVIDRCPLPGPVAKPYVPLKPLQRPNFYLGAWESEFCRDCYAWLPCMDLRLSSKGSKAVGLGHGDTRRAVQAAMRRAA